MTYLKELVAKNLILRDGDGGKTSPDAGEVKAPADAKTSPDVKAPADDTKALASANDQSPQQNQPGLDPKALANLMGGINASQPQGPAKQGGGDNSN